MFCISLIFLLLLNACDKQESTIQPKANDVKDIPFYVPIPSVDFDWENTDFININGVSIALPWYGGTETAIPKEIIDSHKSSYGWMLVYNTIDYAYHSQKLNYLIFHNVLTGRVRVFYYAIDPSGNNNIWRLQLSGGINNLLNSLNYFTQPSSNKYSNEYCHNTNLVEGNTTSGIYPGWNCFEIEFVYDPNLANNGNINTFSIRSDSYNITNITLNGSFVSKTSGQIIIPGSTNPFSSFVNGFAKKIGESSKAWFQTKGDSIKNIPTTILSALINGTSNLTENLIQSGVSGIFNSFLGRYSTSTPTIHSIALSTQGKFEAIGTLQSSAPDASVTPISGLLIPGSNTTGYNGLLPTPNSLNIAWGAWTLESSPIVKYSKYSNFLESLNEEEDLYDQNYWIDPSSIKLNLNPKLLSSISSYSVYTELWYYHKFQNQLLWNGTILSTPLFDEYITDRNIKFRDNENAFYSKVSSVVYSRIRKSSNPTKVLMRGYDNRFVVKVYLKIIPKAPYSNEPIIMVRSYLPQYIGV